MTRKGPILRSALFATSHLCVRSVLHLLEGLGEGLGGLAPTRPALLTLRGPGVVAGVSRIPIGTAVTAVARTLPTAAARAPTAPIPAAISTPAVTAASTSLTASRPPPPPPEGASLLGKGRTRKGLDEFEAHLAPLDLADPDLEHVTVGQVVLDPLDPLGAVET